MWRKNLTVESRTLLYYVIEQESNRKTPICTSVDTQEPTPYSLELSILALVNPHGDSQPI